MKVSATDLRHRKAQWVTIRGHDKRNPVLLVLHGDPGYVELPLSWWYTRGWEEYFTVVQWDQRGGRSGERIGARMRTAHGERAIERQRPSCGHGA